MRWRSIESVKHLRKLSQQRPLVASFKLESVIHLHELWEKGPMS